MCSSDLSWLCNSFTASLQPHTDSEPILLSKEKEKEILVHLSQVSRQIQCRLNQFGLKMEQEIGASPATAKCIQTTEPLSRGAHNCLKSIMSLLENPTRILDDVYLTSLAPFWMYRNLRME